jgi:hypothetical protein
MKSFAAALLVLGLATCSAGSIEDLSEKVIASNKVEDFVEDEESLMSGLMAEIWDESSDFGALVLDPSFNSTDLTHDKSLQTGRRRRFTRRRRRRRAASCPAGTSVNNNYPGRTNSNWACCSGCPIVHACYGGCGPQHCTCLRPHSHSPHAHHSHSPHAHHSHSPHSHHR